MAQGQVRKWIADRGFGFIRPDDGDADIFVHVTALPQGVTELQYGQRVEFVIEQDGAGRSRAVDVILCAGG